MQTVEVRVSWLERHHVDVRIEVPDDWDGDIDEYIEDDAIEVAKSVNRVLPHQSCDDCHNYDVEVAEP